MSIRVGDIELCMGPSEVGAPDDLEAAIVGFIDGARRGLDIAVQELDSWRIAEAIVNARQRRVRVRLVVEADYLKSERAAADPFAASGRHEVNRQIQNVILRTATNIWSDFNPKIFHQKFIIRDGSAVLTGSTNFTDSGTHKNLNHVVIIESRKVANIYRREFDEIRRGHFGALNEGHDPKPRRVDVSGVPVKVLFAPDHGPEMEVMKQMAKTKERIDFAVFTFSRSTGIDDQMVLLAELGRSIRGVMDGLSINQKWAATKLVRAAGIPVWKVRKRDQLGKLHHKLMILDEQVLIVGSFNYTGPANLLNDENIVILGDLDTEDTASRDEQKKLARFALDEFERIIRDHGEPVPEPED